MIGFFHITICISNDSVISQMVLDVEMVAVVRKVNVSRFGQQGFGRTVFIDHISAVVCSCGCTIYNMYRSQLLSVGRVGIGDGISITERNYLWQR